MIVGNRDDAHRLSLEQGAAVLITGGFDAADDVKALANELSLPIISSSYDTFTVAAMINRAIYDNLIKKEIILVEDICTPFVNTCYLNSTDRVADWYRKSADSGHTRIPVIDEHEHLLGIVAAKDVIGMADDVPIDRVMTRHLITTGPRTTIAAAAHLMVWEGIDLLPVIAHNRKLFGIISRSDVIKAMQYMQKQPQMGETFEDLILSHLSFSKESGSIVLKGKVVPQMTNTYGTLSSGVLLTAMTEASRQALRTVKKGDYVIENTSIYFLKPVQIDQELSIKPTILEIGRKFGKVDVEVFSAGKLIAKAMVTAQVWEGQ